MKLSLLRPAMIPGLIAAAFIVVAQGARFPGGVFKGNDGTNNIALDFDTTGVVTAYVNDQAFSSGKYESKADTLMVGAISGPEGYSCAGSGKYLWSLKENRLTLTIVTDECQVRIDAFTGLVWMKGW